MPDPARYRIVSDDFVPQYDHGCICTKLARSCWGLLEKSGGGLDRTDGLLQDFDLRWDFRSQILQGGVDRVTIFDAVEKQLGLVLELQKVPSPVIVVERVNEQPTDNPPDVAQELPARELEFEVADVKPSRPDEKDGPLRITRGGGLEARAVAMRIVVATAWDTDWDHVDELIAGLPKWADAARFDIHAKTSTATNGPPLPGSGFIEDDVRLMLRALLIDRFRMKTHYEDRLTNAALYTGGGKTKTQESGPLQSFELQGSSRSCKRSKRLESKAFKTGHLPKHDDGAICEAAFRPCARVYS